MVASECVVIPFPRNGQADDVDDALGQAMRALAAASAERQDALREWRVASAELTLAAAQLSRATADCADRMDAANIALCRIGRDVAEMTVADR